MINSRKAVTPDSLDKTREGFNNAERFYLLNKKNIQTGDLAWLLPTLEQEINEETTVAQFNSFYLFLTLCFRYQEKLPDSFSEFKGAGVLADKFLNLKKSSLFKVQTTRGDKNFVENAIKKLMLVPKLDESASSGPEEKAETFSSTEKDLLMVFGKSPGKPSLTTKALEKHQEKRVEETKEKGPASFSSQSAVFMKKRKHNETETTSQSLEKVDRPSRLGQRAITSNKLLLPGHR